MRRIVIASVLVTTLAFVTTARAEVLADWTFENVTINGTGYDYGPIPTDPSIPQVYGGEAWGFHASASTAWGGNPGNGSWTSFASNRWTIGDVYLFQTSSTGYFDVTIAWHQTRNANGPATFSLQWSTDGETWNTLTPTYTVNAITWSSTPPPNAASSFGPTAAPSALDNQPVIYFQLVSLVTSPSSGTNRVDNIVISGYTGDPLGACCIQWGGTHCSDLTQTDCTYSPVPGYWQGPGTSCSQHPCPANDDCYRRLDVSEGTYSFDTAFATYGDECGAVPSCFTNPGHTIWYCYHATCTGFATISLCGSAFDTMLAVFNGCPQYAPTELACNDNYSGCAPQSRTTFLVTAGQSYLFEVAGKNGAFGTGTVSITCDPTGACCQEATGNCTITTQASCGFTWKGVSTTCNEQTCPHPGACCFHDGHCEQILQAACAQAGGTSWTMNALCAPNPCPFVKGDVNCDHAVNTDDIPYFVAALIGGYSGCDITLADMNGDGVVDGLDIPGFVNGLLTP